MIVGKAPELILMARHSSPLISAFGEEKTLREWKDDSRCVVPERTLYRRVSSGEPLVEALTRPAWNLLSWAALLFAIFS